MHVGQVFPTSAEKLLIHGLFVQDTVKPVLNGHSKEDHKRDFKTGNQLMH